ncbi:hypothetical protein, partial [Fictibacillus fluitans]
GASTYLTGASTYLTGASTYLVSSGPLFPLDKESSGSETSHEENGKFIFEESRILHYNQRLSEVLTYT